MILAGRADESRAHADQSLTRRGFLGALGAAGVGVSVPGLLAGCGSGSSPSATSTAVGQAARGGTMRLGLLGNGTSETLYPPLGGAPIDALRILSVFDPLVRVAPNYRTSPGLAVGWQPNADATVWEIKLRDGVSWHDGKPFTAEDVIYSLKAMAAPTSVASPYIANIKLGEVKKLNAHLLRVPLHRADARLFDSFNGVNFNTAIIQNGATPKDFAKPVGTGPFKAQSFTPGQQSVFVANSDYWGGAPYLEQLRITSIDDDTARYNALVSGQVDVCSPLPYVQAKAPGTGVRVLVGVPGNATYFYMRLDRPPFSDPRVRLAIKLLADRPGLINAAFSGFGGVGNDLVGYGLPFYDFSLPQRHQDVEQAKSLLKSAGQSDLRVTLQTSPVATGIVEAATAFAQQAASAGVTIQVKRELPSSYYNPSILLGHMAFAQDVYPTGSLAQFYVASAVPGAFQNNTHYGTGATTALLYRAVATLDKTEATALWHQFEKQFYELSGNLVWCNIRNVDGLGAKVAGVGGPGTGWAFPLGDFDVRKWGFTK